MGVPEILAEPNTPHWWQYPDIVPYHNTEIVVPAFVVGTPHIRRGMAAFPSKSRLAALRFADFAVVALLHSQLPPGAVVARQLVDGHAGQAFPLGGENRSIVHSVPYNSLAG